MVQWILTFGRPIVYRTELVLLFPCPSCCYFNPSWSPSLHPVLPLLDCWQGNH